MTVDPELEALILEHQASRSAEDPWQQLVQRTADTLSAHVLVDRIDRCKCGAVVAPPHLGGLNAHIAPMIVDLLSAAYRTGATTTLEEATKAVRTKCLYEGRDVRAWLLQFAEQIRNGQPGEERNAAQRNN